MLNLTSDNNVANSDDFPHRWSFCYLTGEAQDENCTDIFMAVQSKPENGFHHAMLNGEPAIIVIEQDENIQVGLVALMSDIQTVGSITSKQISTSIS